MTRCIMRASAIQKNNLNDIFVAEAKNSMIMHFGKYQKKRDSQQNVIKQYCSIAFLENFASISILKQTTYPFMIDG